MTMSEPRPITVIPKGGQWGRARCSYLVSIGPKYVRYGDPERRHVDWAPRSVVVVLNGHHQDLVTEVNHVLADYQGKLAAWQLAQHKAQQAFAEQWRQENPPPPPPADVEAALAERKLAELIIGTVRPQALITAEGSPAEGSPTS